MPMFELRWSPMVAKVGVFQVSEVPTNWYNYPISIRIELKTYEEYFHVYEQQKNERKIINEDYCMTMHALDRQAGEI